MLIVSTRDFRDNQKAYLDMLDQGAEILIQRKNKAYRILPVKEDDTLLSKEDFFAKVDKAIEAARQGKVTKLTPELRKQLFGDQ